MSKIHDTLVEKLSLEHKKIALNKPRAVYVDSVFYDKASFRKKNVDLLFVYEYQGVPVEVKRGVKLSSRKEAIIDILNGAFVLEQTLGLEVPYGVFVAYDLKKKQQKNYKNALPFTKEIPLISVGVDVPTGYFSKVDGINIYSEKIPRTYLQNFKLLKEIKASEKNNVDRKKAKRSMKRFRQTPYQS